MSAGLALDALTVECPTCRAQVRAACYYAPQPGTWWPRDPHPARIEAARAALLSQPQRSESAWLELATIWRDASEDDRRAILAVVKLRQAMPAGVDEVVAVLERGAAKHNGGDLRVAATWTAEACAEHLDAHAHELRTWGVAAVDDETGRLVVAHIGARAVMVGQIVRERG